MKSFAKLGSALALAAFALAAQAEMIPAKDDAAMAAAAKHVVVTLKDDADFSGYANRVHDNRRMRASPQNWEYLDRGVLGAVQALEETLHFQAEHVYSRTIKGFSAKLTPAQLAALHANPTVRSVDAAVQMWPAAQTLPWGIRQIGGHLSSTRSGDGTGSVRGVHVYLIDTGIELANRDLNVIGFRSFGGREGDYFLCGDHGTHMAGTIGAKDNDLDVVGVAPGVPLIAVSTVYACRGDMLYVDSVLKAIDWVTDVALTPSIVAIGLSTVTFAPLDEAIRRSAAKGLFYVVAAGNDGGHACDRSPARAGFGFFNGIVTVGATDMDDREAWFSNSGECVDLWAPGVAILSTSLRDGLATRSGTSMAAAHVAGIAALLVSQAPGLQPGSLELALKSATTFPGTFSRDGRPIARVNAHPF